MSTLSEQQALPKPCPGCGRDVEPEVDGDHLYYECDADDCEGYAFGYVRVAVPEGDEDCAVGVPEDIRRLASAPMEAALAAEQKAQPVPIQIGRRPE